MIFDDDGVEFGPDDQGKCLKEIPYEKWGWCSNNCSNPVDEGFDLCDNCLDSMAIDMMSQNNNTSSVLLFDTYEELELF